MILSELLDQWTDLGIILWEDDGRLRYRAPRGVVTSGVISQLRANKEDILARLRERRTVLSPSRSQTFRAPT